MIKKSLLEKQKTDEILFIIMVSLFIVIWTMLVIIMGL